jgi:hypothetical protein
VFLSTSIAGVSLFLALYFFLASYSKKGKILVFAAACLLTLAAIGAGTFLPLWNVAIVLLVLILAVSYLISKRVEMVKLQDKQEEEYASSAKEALDASADEIENVDKENVLADKLPLAKDLPSEQEEGRQKEMAFPVEMAGIVDDVPVFDDDTVMEPPFSEKQTSDPAFSAQAAVEEEAHLLLDGETARDNIDAEETGFTSSDYIEELDFIHQQDEEETSMLIKPLEREEEEEISFAGMSLEELTNNEIEPPVMNDYNLHEQSEKSLPTNLEENDLDGQDRERWPDLDADLLALFEEDHHKDRAVEDLPFSTDEEESTILFSLQKEESTAEEENSAPEEDVYTELMKFVETVADDQGLDDDTAIEDERHEEQIKEPAVQELVPIVPSEVEETPSEGAASPVLHQALWNIALEQLQLYEQIQTPEEHEELLKEYLSSNLSDYEHYMVAAMLVRHYGQQQKVREAEELLGQLKNMYADYPVLLEELNYLSLIINN